jgi:hypothetical protein
MQPFECQWRGEDQGRENEKKGGKSKGHGWAFSSRISFFDATN